MMEELERKVMNKHKIEYEDMLDQAEANHKFFNLSIGHNRDILEAFLSTLGEQVLDKEESQIE